jgi:hypothetical protein
VKKAVFPFLMTLCLIFSACASEPTPAPATEPAAAAPVDAAADPLSGTWTGDWGPNANDRNPVTLELKWDGTNLTGTVNPGPDAIPLTKAAYAKETSMITMEADAKTRGGATVHYTIEGKVDGKMMSGSWSHDDKKGDFKLTKS